MRIGVLSDSHTDSIHGLSRKVVDELSGVDLIIHAGDYTEKRLLEDLRRRGNFKGVYGNKDPLEIRQELPALEIVVVGNFRIGISHPAEGGTPFGIEARLATKLQNVDVIIFGHTHMHKNERRGGTIYFNPGSATGTFPAFRKTFGIIRVGSEIEGEILRVE